MATVRAKEELAATRNSVEKLLGERNAIVARAVDLAERSRRLEELVAATNRHLSSISPLRKAVDTCAKNGGSIRAAVESASTGLAAASRVGKAQLRTVAVVEGIALLSPTFVRYSAVIGSALPGLQLMSSESLLGATAKDLARRSKEGQQLTSTLDRAERQLKDGARLFEPANIQKLETLVQHQLRSADITPRLRKALDSVYAVASGTVRAF